MAILLPVAVLALLGVTLVVGGRLLWLVWRTRRLPELCMGLGIYLAATVGAPLEAVATHPLAADVPLGIFALARLVESVGVSCLFLFTWLTFGAGRPATASFTGVWVVVLLATVAGSVAAVASAAPDETTYAATRNWSSLQIGATGVCFGWTAIESLRHWRRMRRRLAIGLADPVLAHRFLLWSVYGISTLAIMATHAAYHLSGVPSILQPPAQLVTALGGLVGSASLYLAFVPPGAYLRWLERRYAGAPASRATTGAKASSTESPTETMEIP